MSFIEKISDDDYEMNLENDYVLSVRYGVDNSSDVHYQYDFVARVMTLSSENDAGGQSIVPFSQLDPEALHFFRNQFIKLKGKPPALPDDIVKPSAPPSESWVDMGAGSIAHVSIYPQMQRKLTKIFNFESRQLQVITENLRTHTEAINPPIGFDDILSALVENAVRQFELQGKMVDKGFVLRGITRLDK